LENQDAYNLPRSGFVQQTAPVRTLQPSASAGGTYLFFITTILLSPRRCAV